jgi:FixJ family two-component response regulator
MHDTVYMVDDDPAVRDSLRFVVESAGHRVETFENARQMIDRARRPVAGCLVVDLRLPGMSGLELCRHLRDQGIELPTIMITGHGDVDAAVRAFRGGVIDFLEKPFSDQALLQRIQQGLQIDARQRENHGRCELLQRREASLTPRERQVLAAVVRGHPNKQIADDLGLSPKTIEVHRSHMMRKMEATSLADLVRMAVDLEELTTA